MFTEKIKKKKKQRANQNIWSRDLVLIFRKTNMLIVAV